MYTLYSIPGSCSTGIHVLLNTLKQPVEVVNRNNVGNYSALVPTNQVPALQHNDRLMTEGAAIVLHLLNEHNVDIAQYGNEKEFYQWLMFNYATLHPAYSKLFNAQSQLDDGPGKLVFMQKLGDRVAELWQILDQRLTKQAFVVGNNPSIVDYLLAVYANWGNAFEDVAILLGENVKRVIKHVAEMPEFIAAYQHEGATHMLPPNSY